MSKNGRLKRAPIVLVSALVFVFFCFTGAVCKTKVTQVSIYGPYSVPVGKTIQLETLVLPTDATDKSVTWSSGNTSRATVSQSGVVTGKSAGAVTIMAKANDGSGMSGTKEISVTPSVSSITVSGASSVNVGSSITLGVSVLPSGADNKAVTWSSSDTSKATVSSSGVVSGKAAGPVTITAAAQDGSGVRGSKLISVSLAPGITVTVKNASGNALSGAVVQFRRPNAPDTRSYRTNANGIAVYPNAPAATYGINVTHANYAATSSTSSSSTFTRSSSTAAQSYTFTMSEPASTFRNLNWAHMLESMGTASSPNYELSSVYGWRYYNGGWEGHQGIDIVHRTQSSTGKKLYAAFDGEVVGVYSGGTGGIGIVIQYKPPGSSTDYYVRYLHMRDLPAKADGTKLSSLSPNNKVKRGEQIGYLGYSGLNSYYDAHLHFDIHRNYNPYVRGSSFAYTIDPRAFYTDGLIAPWPDLRIQN